MKNGSVLVISLLLLLFLMLIVTFLLELHSQLVRNLTLQRQRLLVSNVARSGAFTLAEYLSSDQRRIGDLIDGNGTTSFSASLPEFDEEGGVIRYEVTRSDTDLSITCEASLGSVSERYTLKLSQRDVRFTFASVEGSITAHNNMTIKGDVVVSNGVLKAHRNAEIHGNVFLKNGSVDGVRVTGSIRNIPDVRFPLPPDPQFNNERNLSGKEITIHESGYKYNLNFQQGKNTLILDTTDASPLWFAVGNLNLDNNTDIEVRGNGTVMIYVEGDITAGNNVQIIIEQNARVLIYSDREGRFEFRNNFSVVKGVKSEVPGELYIYAPRKRIEFGNTANPNRPDMIGSIVAKSITVKNNFNIEVSSSPPNFPILQGPEYNPFHIKIFTYEGWTR
ncbi:MAG: hypothetical protein H5T93_09860 [Pseudothermotoga sp.]|uniref:DUF7305 domain-containing protein n=1 Tax=Pseudothermotoga sp. TaxID=2033661 RepID=UPI001984BD63|nr:hypothetical protein [Pseudothermotoga sp.]MBC7122381.1 hypothetical protein [Pseudothermotoga sp.]